VGEHRGPRQARRGGRRLLVCDGLNVGEDLFGVLDAQLVVADVSAGTVAPQFGEVDLVIGLTGGAGDALDEMRIGETELG
jgi:hypothetical protein